MKLDTNTLRALDHAGDEFMAVTLRRETDLRDNLAALFELGAVLTRLRRFEEGLEIDRRLVMLEPLEPILRYNLACSLALLAKNGEALDELERAVELGYNDADHMVRDRDLRSVRAHTRFEKLVQRVRELQNGSSATA